jgi:O-antigen/teichoic acid export membrane protein
MSGPEVTRSLTRTTAYGVGVRAVGMALGLAMAIFLARNLAAEDLGAYQGVLNICIILGGLASATSERPATRRIAALHGDDPEELRTEVAIAHAVVGIAALAVVLALVAGSLLPAVPETARATMRLAALATPGVAILSLRQWIALPLQGVAASLGPEQIGQPILFLGVASLALHRSGLGPFEALAIYAAAGWTVWLASSWRSGLLSLLRDGIRELPSARRLRARFIEGRPFVLLTTVAVLPTYATVPIIAALLGRSDAGRLAIALQLTALVAVPLQIVSLATMPRCAALHRDGDTAAIDTMVRAASTLSLALGIGLAAVLLVGLDTILGALGPSFTATSSLIPILVAGQLINAALGPNGPTLQMIGLERELVRVEGGVTALRMVAVVLAASAGSIVGVAFALTVTSALRNLLLSTTLYRRAGILTLPQFPPRRAHRP